MSIQNLLQQLLQSGAAQVERARQSGDLGKYATGAAAGGALALLLGSQRGRRIGASALKLGSVAAIGALAWKAYQDHQAAQQAQPPAGAAGAPQPTPSVPGFAALPAPQLERHSQEIGRAHV